MARWGQGYVGASLPAAAVAGAFERARGAWANAGRDGSLRLVAIGYFALSQPDRARTNIWDYYRGSGTGYADAAAANVLVSPAATRDAVKAFEDIGTDEVILNPALDDIQEVQRLAEAVL
jgi:alkanesulfonate monooxygenase SsuD/methylene tetrahydromethanopterin reductase-like flavin-dependent oxidoreductase (luciferase family)